MAAFRRSERRFRHPAVAQNRCLGSRWGRFCSSARCRDGMALGVL